MDDVPRRGQPIATWALIAVNVLAFFLLVGLPESELREVFYLFGIVPRRFTHPEWAEWAGFPADSYWPFVTSMFLHGGWVHLLSNVWSLWLFGDNVEEEMGTGRYLAFYFLCGVVAGIVHWFTNPDSPVPAVGASGAIAGVLGAYLLSFPRARLIVLVPILFYPLFFEVPAVFYLGLWFLSQFFTGALALVSPEAAGGIAVWAHVGGFVAGVATFALFLKPRGLRRRLEEDEGWIEQAWRPH